MSLLEWIGVAALGGCGAALRLAADGAVSARVAGSFPLGTLAVNLLGTLALGVLVGVGIGETSLRLVGVGLLGGFTTFSTWMLESERLAEDGQAATAAANIAVSLVCGVALAWLGMRIGEVL